MEKKLEIKKLADVAVWADNEIEELKDALTEEEFEDCDEAKDLEVVKKVVLEAINRHNTYTNALNKDVADKAAKIELLEKELEGRKEGYTALKELMDTKYISIDDHNKICTHMEEESDRVIGDRDSVMDGLYGEIARRQEEVKKLNKTIMSRNNEINTLTSTLKSTRAEIEAHESENARLSDIIKNLRASNEKLKKENGDYAIRVNNLTKELEKTYAEKEADLKNHNRRDMNLVDELAGKNDKIKSLVEEIEYYKSQEHIRTDQLRATESKVEQLYKEIEQLKDENSYLKKECKNKNDVIRKAYVRYVDEACKGREEIMNECYKKLTKDDTGYQGFKQYTLRALEAEKGNEEKTKEFIDCAASIIFYNKKAEEKRKEEAKKELNEAFGVPCGEDSIE